MKKYIISFILLTLSCISFSFGKSASEICNEFNELKLTADKKLYASVNKQDILAVIGDYKTSDLTKRSHEESFGGEDRKTWETYRKVALIGYIFYQDSELNFTDDQAFKLNIDLFYSKTGEEMYNKIKANNFTIDGRKLQELEKYYYILVAKDYSLIMDIDFTKYYSFNFFINRYMSEIIKHCVLTANKEAYDKLVSVEGVLMTKDASDKKTEWLKNIQDAEDYIYLKLIREKNF